jgi:D-alanyl-D-alanine dipeptidase
MRVPVFFALALLVGCSHPLREPALVDLGRIDDSIAARCLLSERAASALVAIQRELRSHDLGLLVYDCYRPQKAVDHFVRWSHETSNARTRTDYHPKIDKSRLFELGYIAAKSGHSRGSTVDLTLLGRGRDSKWLPLDMGTPFDFFDSSSNTESIEVTQPQRKNRILLRDVMERGGFQNFPKEWWHYTLRDEPYPNDYWNQSVE